MIRVNSNYAVFTFPQHYAGREIAARVEIRDRHNNTTATLYTGPTLAEAWEAAERHINAVETYRREGSA